MTDSSLWDKTTDYLAFRLAIAYVTSQLILSIFVTQSLTLANSLLILAIDKSSLPNIPPIVVTIWSYETTAIFLASLFFVWFWAIFKNKVKIGKWEI